MIIFEVCAYLFEFKQGDAPEADQTPQYDLPDLRGRQEYIEYFEDSAEASLKCRNLSLSQKSDKRCRFTKISDGLFRFYVYKIIVIYCKILLRTDFSAGFRELIDL